MLAPSGSKKSTCKLRSARAVSTIFWHVQILKTSTCGTMWSGVLKTALTKVDFTWAKLSFQKSTYLPFKTTRHWNDHSKWSILGEQAYLHEHEWLPPRELEPHLECANYYYWTCKFHVHWWEDHRVYSYNRLANIKLTVTKADVHLESDTVFNSVECYETRHFNPYKKVEYGKRHFLQLTT